MWRVHLGTDDIGRVRLARDIDPLWEVTNSLQTIANGDAPVVFDAWRRNLQLRRRDRWRVLRTLIPPLGYTPDFLTPAAGSTDLRTGLEAVLRTPRLVLRRDLERFGRSRRLPSWTQALAAGEPEILKRLGATIHNYFDAHLAPYWNELRRQVGVELGRRREVLCDSGSIGLLASLQGVLRWDPPAIVLTSKLGERDIHVDGRGITLQPSFFAYGDTTVLDVPTEPLVLIYPVQHQLGWWQPGGPGPDRLPLQALLGRTRATALQCVGDGACGTIELAHRLGTSAATASEQAKVLRESGLLTTDREGKHVVHHLSSLGCGLLNFARTCDW
jgi:hypothetical protein